MSLPGQLENMDVKVSHGLMFLLGLTSSDAERVKRNEEILDVMVLKGNFILHFLAMVKLFHSYERPRKLWD